MRMDRFTRRGALTVAGALAAALALAPGALRAEGPARPTGDMMLGDPDAPVTVIEYASLTCPHCATFHRDVFPALKEEFIETGQVLFIHREVYFDRAGLWAAMIARCAGEDRYFGVLDLLYARQAEWSRAADVPSLMDQLFAIGRQAGMDDDEMQACMQDQAFAEALVAAYQAHATADGIQSTPSFIIDGERTGNIPLSEFRQRLNAALGS